MMGRFGRRVDPVCGGWRGLAATVRATRGIARLVVGAALLLAPIAVVLGRGGPAALTGPAVEAGVPLRIDALALSTAPGPDHFLDPETGRPVVAALPRGGGLRASAWAPWRDGHGRTRLVGLWVPTSPDYISEHTLVRFSQPDGVALDRLPVDDMPAWSGAPCWFPDRTERLLLAGGDGFIYRLDFEGTDARGPFPRPLPWRLPAGAPRIAKIGDLTWPAGPQLGGRVVLASLCLFNDGPPMPDRWVVWWLRLDEGKAAIVAGGPLIRRKGPAASGEDARFPVMSQGPGAPVLAWLGRPRCEAGPWRLRVAPMEIDPSSGEPSLREERAETLAGDCALVAPMFLAGGTQIGYVTRSAGPPGVRRLILPGPGGWMPSSS